MTIPWHLQKIIDSQSLQALGADDQRASSGKSRHLNGEELRYVTDAFANRSRGKGDRRAFTKFLLAVLQTGQQQLKVVTPLTVGPAFSRQRARQLTINDLRFLDGHVFA